MEKLKPETKIGVRNKYYNPEELKVEIQNKTKVGISYVISFYKNLRLDLEIDQKAMDIFFGKK